MKTLNILTPAALVAAFLTTAAFANDAVLTPVNHGRGVTYLFRSAEKEATVAVYPNGIARKAPALRGELRLKKHEMAQGGTHFQFVEEK